MALELLAKTVQKVREDAAVRDAIVRGDERLLEGFTTEEREALKSLATRLQRGEGLPKHQKRNASLAPWF